MKRTDNTLKKLLKILLIAVVLFSHNVAFANSQRIRIKDLADFEGVRDNILIGYGLIVGLNGTGDSVSSIPFTKQSLISMLEQLGVNSAKAADQVKTKNVAAVMVTAHMSAFARQGSKLDVTVSSLGDAKSLEGGLLLATPLSGADSNVYAVAQGSLLIGGFTAEGGSGTITKNHPTVARISDGATVERETGFELTDNNRLRLILRSPDFTTAIRIEHALNDSFRSKISKAQDNGTVDIFLPERFKPQLVAAMQKIENIRVTPDVPARVIIDEKTGTIVMGEDVRISNVAISHSNLTIKVSDFQTISQPEAFSEGETTPTVQTTIEVEEGDGHFKVMRTGVNLADLVNGLNSLGVKPRDIISILQNIKAAGALQAELKLM